MRRGSEPPRYSVWRNRRAKGESPPRCETAAFQRWAFTNRANAPRSAAMRGLAKCRETRFGATAAPHRTRRVLASWRWPDPVGRGDPTAPPQVGSMPRGEAEPRSGRYEGCGLLTASRCQVPRSDPKVPRSVPKVPRSSGEVPRSVSVLPRFAAMLGFAVLPRTPLSTLSTLKTLMTLTTRRALTRKCRAPNQKCRARLAV